MDGSCNGSVSRLDVLEGPSGRRQRTEAERARIAAESLIAGVRLADIARRHGTKRWQIYNRRRKLRTGQLVVPEGRASLSMFAELVVEGGAAVEPQAGAASEVRIARRSAPPLGHHPHPFGDPQPPRRAHAPRGNVAVQHRRAMRRGNLRGRVRAVVGHHQQVRPLARQRAKAGGDPRRAI